MSALKAALVQLRVGPRSRFSPYILTLVLMLVLLAGSFAASYRIATVELEAVAFEVDRAAFREAVTAAETVVSLADTILLTVLKSRPMRDFATGRFSTAAERRLQTRALQTYMRVVSSTMPGIVRVAVVPESGEFVATNQTYYARDEYWDPAGIDMAETAPVRGRFVGPRSVSTGDLERSWHGRVVTIARGYPVGVAPNLALGGAIIYLDAQQIERAFAELEQRIGVTVRIHGATSPGDLALPADAEAGEALWRSQPLVGLRSGWTYVGYGLADPLREARVFRRLFSSVAIGLMIVAVLAITVLERATRRPLESAIKHIAERVHRVRRDTEPDGGGPSLADVEREVRSIVDEAERLQSQVELSLPALRWQLLLERLLSPSGSLADDLAGPVGLDLPGPYFTVVLFARATDEREDVSRVRSAVLERSASKTLREIGAVETVRLMDSTVAAIVSTEEQFPEEQADAWRATVASVDASVVIAVGQTAKGADAIYRSYSTAREALEYRIVAPDRRAYVFGRLPVETGELLPGGIENALRDLPPLLRQESSSRLAGWLDDYIETVKHEARTPALVKHAVVRLVLTFRDEVDRVRRSSELDVEEAVHRIWNSTSIDEVTRIAVACATTAHQEIAAGTLEAPRERRLGADIAAYVDAHVTEPELSLTRVAEAFRVSTSHISRVFRAEVGRTFQEYVVHRRVSEARRMLVEDDRPVVEIAASVGYGDVHSLIRAFKKSHGVTPSEFRRRAIQADVAATGSA
ncbi:MAG: helix-turn-helix domain-containing protein [Spirochaetota bacterium]